MAPIEDVVPSSDWTITPDGDELIVDCNVHGEIGRVLDQYTSPSEETEYERCAQLFRARPCCRRKE